MTEPDKIKEMIDRARRHGASPEYLLSLAKILGVSIPDDTETNDAGSAR